MTFEIIYFSKMTHKIPKMLEMVVKGNLLFDVPNDLALEVNQFRTLTHKLDSGNMGFSPFGT